MKREQVEKVFCFLYEGKIILIKEKEVQEVPYCKMCFLRTLQKLWHQKQPCPAADVVLKEAIELYTGAKLYRLYKGKVISDDELYVKLRDLIKEKYKDYFEEEQARRHEDLKLMNEYNHESIESLFSGRERHYKIHRRPGAKRRR